MIHPFIAELNKIAPKIEKSLKSYLADFSDAPAVLTDAMDYSLTAGGKRLRPALVIFCARTFGLKLDYAMPFACALEFIHTYSLIHDDLPCMDNDALRRGKPTNHKIFGEDIALLAGDALLTSAFELCAQGAKYTGADRAMCAVSILSRAAGAGGMVGGQVSDVFAEGIMDGNSKRAEKLIFNKFFGKKRLKYFTLPAGAKQSGHKDILNYIHANKTAALIRAAAQIGAVIGGAKPADADNMGRFGFSAGMAFQITDDILDAVKTAKELGKSASDKQNKKLTFVSLYGLQESRKMARLWTDVALKNLNKVRYKDKKSVEPLEHLTDFIITRAN